MGRTTEVAADRTADQTRTVMPAELARGFYVTNAPSLAALKLFHLMIAIAAGRMADDTRHELRLATLREIKGMRDHRRASLAPLFEELRGVVVTHGDPDDDDQVVTIGGLLDQAELDRLDPISGDTLISWYFGRMFRNLAEKSDHWAIIDRQTIFNFTSKYSVLLFQHIASFENYEHVDSLTFTVPKLRRLLNIHQGKIKRFADLRRDVLDPAIAEINQLSRFKLETSSTKVGRTVATVTISWTVKADPEPAKRELAGSRVGRKPRRNGTAETAATPAFPATGGLAYEPFWLALKQKAGCNMDNAMIADRFRDWCATRRLALDARNTADTFTAFCAKVGRV